MSNINCNDASINVIGVVTLFGLTQIYYNVANVEHGPLYKHNPIYVGYLGLCALSTFTALRYLHLLR